MAHKKAQVLSRPTQTQMLRESRAKQLQRLAGRNSHSQSVLQKNEEQQLVKAAGKQNELGIQLQSNASTGSQSILLLNKNASPVPGLSLPGSFS